MADHSWWVVLTRVGETSLRRHRLSARRAGAIAAVALLAVGGLAYWVGGFAERRTADAERELLAARIDSLTEENAKVATLATRMAELEDSYERLRAVMGGNVAPSARDILLPPSRAGESAGARPSAAGDRAGPSRWPLVEAGFVTRSFGDTVPGEEPHAGLDIAVPVGSYVRSTGPGVVVEAGEDIEYGKFVRVEHGGNVRTLYAHNSWTFVARGDSVEGGEVIALSGNTGRSTAPHLHLEMERGGTTVDPFPFVSDRL